MRIVVNGWFLDQLTTGSGQYLNALAEWLPRADAGHEFILIRRGGGGEQRSRGAEEQGGRGEAQGTDANTQHATRNTQHAIRNIHAPTPFDHISHNLAKLWFEQVTFPRACRRLAADVAFVPYWGSPWWRPCPVVVTIHDLIPMLLPLYRGGPLQRAYTWLVGRTARRAAAVLTDSEASKHDIVAHLGIAPERVHAIYLAADSRFRAVADSHELDRVRAKYRLPDAPFLLYLGGFDVRKNVGRMIEAFAKMATGVRGQESGGRGQGSEVRLVIAGKLPNTDTAFAPDPRRVVTQLGIEDRVHFTGWVDEADKPALYTLALGTVFVSEYEGFGLPVLEAMGCDR
jgi:glycosyltransferase involved in cell wall biosynthesis